jgi:Na+/H+ antiporter NhaD/arsenite permease-like protein
MELSTVSLAALVAVVLVSCVTNVNIGLLAMSLAWLIGVGVAPYFGEALPAKTIASYFPVELFITLTGTTLLFSVAQQNGTLRWLTDAGVSACRGYTRLVPWLFFVLAMTLSATGAGNVPTVALLASSAMLAGHRLGISPMVMTIMIGHGSIGGTLSPLSPMGVIADVNIKKMGLGDHTMYTFLMNLAVNSIVAICGYLFFRGWQLRPTIHEESQALLANDSKHVDLRWTTSHAATLALIVALIVGVVGFQIHLGLAAIAASTLLIIIGAVDERAAIRELPWNVVLMVCGMTVLVTLCEKNGGLDLFGRLLAACATPETVNGWMAGITGLISVFSSTSGVVLPAFLPTVPVVLGNLSGSTEVTPDKLLAVATAVNIGSNLVDVSSVSTIAALCVAATPSEPARRLLFRQALIWGLAMSVVGAVICGVML